MAEVLKPTPMNSKNARQLPRPSFASALLLAMAATPLALHAQTWDGNGTPNVGGNWSTANLWTLDTVPTTGNTANLDDTGADRTIIYDAGASGALGTLNFNQSSAFANILDIQKSLTVTNLITLGAAAGTERISIGSTSSTGFILTPSGGVTLNTGGNLIMTATGNGGSGVNLGNTGGGGLLTVQGGTLTIAATTGTTSAGSAANTLSMGFNMSSGALTIDNTTGIADRRLTIQGAVNVSGGAISTTRSGGGGAITFQSTNAITWNPTTFDTDITLSMETSGNQSLTTDKTLFVVQGRSTGVKTLTSTASGNGIAQLQLFDNNNAVSNSRTTLRLGSNLTSTSNAGMPAAQSFGNTHESGRIDLGIDTNGNTLDLSAGTGSGLWTPNASTQSGVTNTVWNLSGSGVIKANRFTFSTSAVTTNVASNTVINAVGGNSTANDLGGTGTLDADSIFRYSGAAVTATPATLTANRNLGDLEVSSGALRVLTASTGTVQDLRVSGGTLDLDANTGRTFATISLTGGTLTNGTFATAETNYTGLQTGTVAGRLTGAKQLIKNSAGTLTLSGNNDYSLSTVVQSGTLAITTSSALTGSSSLEVTGGTLDLGGTTLNKFITSLTNGGIIQNGSFLRSSVTGWTLANGTISANLTTTGAGAINITKNTAGTVTLSGANSHAGSTLVAAGTLQLSGSGTLGSGNVTVSGGTLNLGTASITNTLGALTGGGAVNNGTITNNSGAYDVQSGSIGAILAGSNGLSKSTAGNVTLSGANTYSGNTTISAGTLALSGAGTFGTGTVTGSGGTIDLGGKSITNTVGALTGGAQIINGTFTNNAGTYDLQSGTMGTVLSGSNVLTKTGAGTVTLNAANTYTGNTTISAGTLALGASGSFANSPVINLGTSGSPGTLNLTAKGSAFAFSTSQTVSGYGTINIGTGNTVTINGTLAPGNSPGITSVIGNLTMAPTTVTNMEIISRTGAAGTAFDQVSVTGALTFDGSLFINTTGLTGLVASDSFFLFNAGSYGAAGLDSVSISGTVYNPGPLAGALGIWTVNDTANNLTFTFTESTGYLAVTAIPEPSAFAVFGGFGALGLVLYRRRRSRV